MIRLRNYRLTGAALMTTALILALSLLLTQAAIATAWAGGGGVLVGRCTDVRDGDTLKVGKFWVRLAGADCPETDQPGGSEATSAACALALNKTLVVLVSSSGYYGRVIGRAVLPDARDLGRVLVEQGHAWASAKDYRPLMEAAQKAKRGLWAEPNPIKPQKWRKLHPKKGRK